MKTNLSEALGLGMFLKREGREVYSSPENPSFSKDTDSPDTINFHLHIRVTIGVPKVSKMRSPGSVFCISFNDNGIFIQGVGKSQGGFRFLPRVEIVRLFTAEPVGERPPYI